MAGDQTVELDAVYLPVKSVEEVEDALEGYARVQGKAAAGPSGPLVRGEGFEVDCDWILRIAAISGFGPAA